jgi:hypothetical protein
MKQYNQQRGMKVRGRIIVILARICIIFTFRRMFENCFVRRDRNCKFEIRNGINTKIQRSKDLLRGPSRSCEKICERVSSSWHHVVVSMCKGEMLAKPMKRFGSILVGLSMRIVRSNGERLYGTCGHQCHRSYDYDSPQVVAAGETENSRHESSARSIPSNSCLTQLQRFAPRSFYLAGNDVDKRYKIWYTAPTL